MISKLFESLYLKVFINIVISRSTTTVNIEINSKSGNVDNVEDVFDTTKLNHKMKEFIHPYIEESPFHYISVLDTSEFQGAVPTCDTSKMSKYIDVKSSKYLCYHDNWAYYTLKSDLELLKREFSQVGIDFIFSPFTVLSRFFKDKIDTNNGMYILIEDKYISLAVFSNSQLLYANHMQMNELSDTEDLLLDESSDDEDEELDFDGSIDLDNIDVDVDMGELDDFGDIEDLDSFEDMDDFSEMEDVVDEPKETFKEVDTNSDLSMNEAEAFNEDYERFLLIQNSVNQFYKDDKFESIFVEQVYIADGLDGSADLKRYLEEEMFMSVIVRRIDLNGEVCDLAKAELK